MLSELDIGCMLLGHFPDHRDPNDREIIKERLRTFVYDPSYESEFFKHNAKRSIEDSTYVQALARIVAYSKRYLNADEI
jgi:hypothetical protein